MMESLPFVMLLNIGLLVLIALVFTSIPMVRRLLLEGGHTIMSRIGLACLFGLVSVFSTYTGVRTHGAIVNTRVIGVMAGGLLGGPFVGMGAALIGSLHRYLFDIGGFTAVSCAISTLFEGAVGSVCHRWFKSGKLGMGGVYLITGIVEIGQMAIILLVSRPFDQAAELVRQIAMPMIVMNPIGMICFIQTLNMVFIQEDSVFAEQIRMAFDIADQSLPHLRKGLYSREDMEEAARIIYDKTGCAAVLIMDLHRVLAMEAGRLDPQLLNDQVTGVLLRFSREEEARFFYESAAGQPLYQLLKSHVLVTAPLKEGGEPIGGLVVISKKRWHKAQMDLHFTAELARLFSVQLELAHLENQKKLRRKAELKALQAQVNPHFLYNALNTISYICRENPDRARELILTLSAYYRQTLENDRYMVELSTELQHVSRYLELEKARFEEKLEIRFLVDGSVKCQVPAFILQPLVENAVRYGADKSGKRTVTVSAAYQEDGEHGRAVKVSVCDRGPGLPADIVEALRADDGASQGGPLRGLGLNNVNRRLKSTYGEAYGLHLDSSGEGACVWFLIPDMGQRTDTLSREAPPMRSIQLRDARRVYKGGRGVCT